MAATTITSSPVLSVPVERISAPGNVRELDPAHVDALAGSITLQGLLVPVLVRETIDGYELVAGFHRLAAVRQLGLSEIAVVVREGDSEDADRAVENITRKQLNPYEEAKAVAAMLQRGLTEDGAAQALGWTRQRVTARVKVLALPERAQQLVGRGVIALSSVEQLRAIGTASAELLDVLVAYLDENPSDAARFASDPGWTLGAALGETNRRVFAAYLSTIGPLQIAELRLGKTTDALYKQADELHRQVDRYAYGPPSVRFSDGHVDQARAAGALIEFERGAPIIVDRSLYRELTKDAIKQTLEQLKTKTADATNAKKTARAKTPADPVALARRERDAQLRELAAQAHGVNLELGASLLNGLAAVDPSDLTVARFFVYALLGPDHTGSSYDKTGERIQQLAMGGIRLITGELRTDATRTRKDGTRGALRIEYPADPESALRWLWRFLDGAKTSGELYGRALVVLAAEAHASQLVLPASKRRTPTRWGSHNDHALKALKKLAGPYLPAALTRLERAVQQTHDAYERAEHQARRNTTRARPQQHDQEPADEPTTIDDEDTD
jgi:ParB/RepB/Spo0J family partition protein